MSRVHFNEDCDSPEAILDAGRWENNLRRQIKGKRGQAFLRELLAALEALPSKRLIANAVARDREVCTLGALALKRRTDAGEPRVDVLDDLAKLVVDDDDERAFDDDADVEDMADWARAVLGCPSMLASVIPYEQDDYDVTEWDGGKYSGRRQPTPEERYEFMIRWVRARIVDGGAAA